MVLVNEEHGTFVYHASQRIGFRSQPSVGDDALIKSKTAEVGKLFAVECIQPSRIGSNNGA